MENRRAKNSHYYAELYGTIMPMQRYACPDIPQNTVAYRSVASLLQLRTVAENEAGQDQNNARKHTGKIAPVTAGRLRQIKGGKYGYDQDYHTTKIN